MGCANVEEVERGGDECSGRVAVLVGHTWPELTAREPVPPSRQQESATPRSAHEQDILRGSPLACQSIAHRNLPPAAPVTVQIASCRRFHLLCPSG